MKGSRAAGLSLLLIASLCACISIGTAQFTTPFGCARDVKTTVFNGNGIRCFRTYTLNQGVDCSLDAASDRDALAPGLASFSANDIRGKVTIDPKWNGTEDDCCKACCSRQCKRAEYTWTKLEDSETEAYAVCALLLYEPTPDDLGPNSLEIVGLTGCGGASPPPASNSSSPPTTVPRSPGTSPSAAGSPPTNGDSGASPPSKDNTSKYVKIGIAVGIGIVALISLRVLWKCCCRGSSSTAAAAAAPPAGHVQPIYHNSMAQPGLPSAPVFYYGSGHTAMQAPSFPHEPHAPAGPYSNHFYPPAGYADKATPDSAPSLVSTASQLAVTCTSAPSQAGTTPSLYALNTVVSGPPSLVAGDLAALSPVDLLLAQLDHLHREGSLLLGHYKVGDRSDRRVGGQGVVQFAVHEHNPRKQYAVKFYLDLSSYLLEEAHLKNPALYHIRPEVEAMVGNADRSICVLGRPLPPMIVTERGESLDEWQRRYPADFAQSLAIMLHLVQRVADMHAAEFVHRDLKPANIIFYPARNDWAIIDFGAAAQTGSLAPMSCTLSYAAPEIVLAMMRGESKAIVHPAVDVWALGVIAWELATRTRAFPLLSRHAVEEAMSGVVELPWEAASDPDFNTRMRQLGFMKDSVLRMLTRDLADRISLQEVLKSWRQILQREDTYRTEAQQPDS